MSQRFTLFAALLLLTLAATTTSADPVLRFPELQDASANPHFGSKFLLDVAFGHDAGLHFGWAKEKNLIGGPSIEFMSAPAVCVQAPAVSAPEPATMLLLGTGLIGIGAVVRRSLKNQRR